jgi:RNA polymerase sigma-70 factor (ECF subfamily)
MVAKNHCLMKLRDKGKHAVEINEQLLTTPYESTHKKEFEAKDLLQGQLEQALQQLNAEQQQCVTLFYLQKKSYQEITVETGYSLLQVKSNIQNGKRNLKIMLERLQQNEQ